jgi:cytochrome b6-f complex iron-sulfur subunit
MKQTRRKFCIDTGKALSLFVAGGAAGTLLEGCSGSPVDAGSAIPSIQASVVNQTITLAIDVDSPLATVGSAALVRYSNSALLVSRTAQDTFMAVSAVCTHQSCTITGYSNQVYICPCHGSQFGVSGNVLRGPASRSLRLYQTQFSNEQLVISL